MEKNGSSSSNSSNSNSSDSNSGSSGDGSYRKLQFKNTKQILTEPRYCI